MNSGNPNVQLTDEDLHTMRRCRKLSFWRGSVPFTVGAVLSVGIAHNLGFFANRPRLRGPCYVLAVIGGYLGGKMSYFSTCRRMFLELNDSRVKDYLLDPKSYARPPGRFDTAPMIVNTPVESDEETKSMTYADRRDLYRKHDQERQPRFDDNIRPSFPPSPAPPLAREIFPNDSVEEEKKSRPSYLNEVRPPGSYQFDDVYRPRE